MPKPPRSWCGYPQLAANRGQHPGYRGFVTDDATPPQAAADPDGHDQPERSHDDQPEAGADPVAQPRKPLSRGIRTVAWLLAMLVAASLLFALTDAQAFTVIGAVLLFGTFLLVRFLFF